MTHLLLVVSGTASCSALTTYADTTSPGKPTAFHLREFGEEVAILDSRGRREATGRIVGRARCNPPIYDVVTKGCKRLCGIPEDRLVSLDRV